MALDRQSFITLDECITSYMDEAELSNHKYFKLWNLAFRCMDEMGMDFFYTIKSVKLPVSSTYTVELPADYINYSKVGVLNQKGEIIPIGYNSKLTTYSDLQSTRKADTSDNSIPDIDTSTPIWYNYWNNGTMDNMYGVPSGSPFIGNFKIDSQNGLIILNECFGYDYLMLEYVSAPKEGETYWVPRACREAVIAYLRWKDIISMPVKTHVANANVNIRRHEYFNERRLALGRIDPFNLSDAYEWNLQLQRLCVKM